MSDKDDFEKSLSQAAVQLDKAKETAPIDVSGFLKDIQADVQYILRKYRENRSEAEDD